MKKNELLVMFNGLIKEESLYHAIIISGESQDEMDEISTEIARMQFCLHHSLKNDDCEWCKKINTQNTTSIFFMGNSVDKIKKTEVAEMMKRFSQTSLEDTKNKMYIIKNGENLTEEASNSILKFLEEPPKNTFAIILTKDKTQLLSTIKSRSKIFTLSSEKNKELEFNKLRDLINDKNKSEILLMGDYFKKMDKKDMIESLEEVYKKNILLEYPQIAELFLETIQSLKNSNYNVLNIENLLIALYEVI